mmetsp:Transcript_5784/g.14816  ORF Transcript_5784/g.14816 Transcript_5784/m.14816 type:complete len:267 (-) Transcript_5784:170-970(-)
MCRATSLQSKHANNTGGGYDRCGPRELLVTDHLLRPTLVVVDLRLLAHAERVILDRAVDHLARVLAAHIAMDLEELDHVKLGLAHDLCFAHEDVLQRENALRRLLHLLADQLWDELVDELLELDRRRLTHHHLTHLCTDLLDLRRRCVARLLQLVRPLARETDAEETQHVAIRRLHVDVRLDQRLPLAHQAAQLVSREVHPVKVCEAVRALHLLALEVHLAERLVLVLVKVRKVDLEHAPLQRVRSDARSARLRHRCLAAVAHGKH